MKWQLILLAGSVSALAQSPGDFEKSVRASMAPGLAQQRASVRQQSGLVTRQPAAASAPGFFTLPPPPVTLSGSAPCDPLPDGELDPLIQSAAGKQEVDPGLVRAVIEQESAGRPCAVSAAGATGLMQLMPDTAEQLDVRDPFDPRENVEAGTRLLKSLLNRYGDDPSLALGAYNAGPTRVDQEGGVPAIPETLDYVAGILSKLKANAGKPAPAKPRN